MHAQWNIVIATTLSMLITFITHCIFEPMKANHSAIEHLKDLMHVFMLSKSCSFQHQLNCTMYDHLLTDDNINHYGIYMFITTLTLSMALLFCYGKHVANYIRMIIFTFLIVWLLTRYCDNQNCWYQIDIITVYFIVWQFMYLMCKWEFVSLSWPLLILQQASCCVSTSITAFFAYDIIFHAAPFRFIIGFLWLYSLYDIFACLHFNGRFHGYGGFLRRMSKAVTPDVYFTYDIEDNDEVDKNSKALLGLGDFTIFNFMILFIMHPIWSMTTKIFVALGCIVCIQVGCYSITRIGQMWQLRVMPGLPFPVIIFSMYTIIIDFVMNYRTIDCSYV